MNVLPGKLLRSPPREKRLPSEHQSARDVPTREFSCTCFIPFDTSFNARAATLTTVPRHRVSAGSAEKGSQPDAHRAADSRLPPAMSSPSFLERVKSPLLSRLALDPEP